MIQGKVSDALEPVGNVDVLKFGQVADLKDRGLSIDPKLAIGDGALGFWSAVRKMFPNIREQRCWFHKSGKCAQ